ncbi:MAG: hypothetical protein R6V50_04005 [Thermoplasmatota archaeon]
MIIDDYIVLGSSYIYNLRDGRKVRCSAGYSPSMGLIRVYPVNGYSHKVKMWNMLHFPAHKNWDDWRKESWKIIDSSDPYQADNHINILRTLEREEKLHIIKKQLLHCPSELNEKKVSLGIVKPNIIKWGIENNKPYVTYRCTPHCLCGSNHHQQILEWGAYEWIRKNPDKANQVFDNYHFGEDDWEHYFLLGNSYRAPKSFMIISVIRWKKNENPS